MLLTKEQVAGICEKIAKNCGSVPQLIFAPLWLELEELGLAGKPATQPQQAPAPAATPQAGAGAAERPRPGVERLWDSQWVNIVNAPEVLAAEDAREAVHLAVKLTEARMAANFAECMASSPAPAATTQQGQDERAAFEAWVKNERGSPWRIALDRADAGNYMYLPAVEAWAVWQARAALSAQAEPQAAAERKDLAAKLRGIANSLQYHHSHEWGVETVGPLNEAAAVLSQPAPAPAQPQQVHDRDPHFGGSSYEASMLRDLLARIHGDGGHHIAEYGLERAMEEAHLLVSGWRASHPPTPSQAPAQPQLSEAEIDAAFRRAYDTEPDTRNDRRWFDLGVRAAMQQKGGAV